jgi:hypothetical protein
MKTMLAGIMLMLLGIGLIQAGNDQYLMQMFPVLGGTIMATVFPITSLALITAGTTIGIAGLFVRREPKLFG